MKYIVANWKANGKLAHTKEFIEQWLALPLIDFKNLEKEIVIAASSLFYLNLKQSALNVKFALQDISIYEGGAHTGEIGIENLDDIKPDYCIVGHSERRRDQNESNQVIVQKVRNLLKAKIIPIICFDLNEVEELALLLKDLLMEKMIFAYEPVEAISTSGGQGNFDVNKLMKIMPKLRVLLPSKPILYGGSVKPENAHEYANISDGLLVGGASLVAESFYQIAKNF